MKTPDSPEYQYPLLWGKNSYNDGAGLYRVSNFARYVKANMPLGASHRKPQLTDDEAWDLDAYVNSMPRPKKDIRKDWPDISKKHFDHPFGPYKDGYSEHKFHTDHWRAFANVLPADRHTVGKAYTKNIEGVNTCLRSRKRRLARKKTCFSKKKEYHLAALNIMFTYRNKQKK